MIVSDPYDTVAISDMAGGIVRHVAEIDGDIGLKIAALRAAADTLAQAVGAMTVKAALAQLLNPKR